LLYNKNDIPGIFENPTGLPDNSNDYTKTEPIQYHVNNPVLYKVIFAINIIVFILMVFIGKVHILSPDIQHLIDWGANFAPITLNNEPYRLITYAFIHIGIVHLLFNMWALNVVGNLCESLFSSLQFFIIYTLSLFGAGITSLYFNQEVVSAGASGAIFGISGAVFVHLLINKVSLPEETRNALKTSYAGFIVYNLLFGLSINGIDNAAHIGGLVTGGITGYSLTSSSIKNKFLAISTIAVFLTGFYFYIPRTTAKFFKIYTWFSHEEARTLRYLRQVLAKISKNKVSSTLKSLKTIIIKFNKLYKGIKSCPLPENSRFARIKRRVEELTFKRITLLKLLYTAIKTNDYSKFSEFLRKSQKLKIEIEKFKKSRRNQDTSSKGGIRSYL